INNVDTIKVDAQTRQTLKSVVVSGAVAIVGQGVAAAGAGASASNISRAVTQAWMNNVSSSGDTSTAKRIAVTAGDVSTLTATAVGAAVAASWSGAAVAIGASLAENLALNTVQASI